MKKLIIPAALLAMACFIGAAMVVDCVRLASDARDRVELADHELAKHEARLVKVLEGYADLPPEVVSNLYQAAGDTRYTIAARHADYERLVKLFQQKVATTLDPTNPQQRKFMDDANGAINRREIAQKQFDAEWQEYEAFMNSRRGRVASKFVDLDATPQWPRFEE